MQFLKTLTIPAWFCFAVAAAGLLSSIYAWLPLPTHATWLSVPLALAAFAAGIVAFLSMAGHHIITWERRKDPQPRIRLPRGFWLSALVSLAYFLAVFFGTFISQPQSANLEPTISLRIAGAATLFFGVSTLGFTQWAGLRVRALQSAP